jgi:hypothetical protein
MIGDIPGEKLYCPCIRLPRLKVEDNLVKKFNQEWDAAKLKYQIKHGRMLWLPGLQTCLPSKPKGFIGPRFKQHHVRRR